MSPAVPDRAALLASEPAGTLAARLARSCGALDGSELLARLLLHELPGRIALVSSFGSEAAVLLHMVAAIDPGTAVIFLDTGKLFGETFRHRDALIRDLGLRDVRTVSAEPARVQAADPDGLLWQRDPDRCCFVRKVEPLARALSGFDAWITGRKRYQGGERAGMPAIEVAGDKVKINPLAGWSRELVEAYVARHQLPAHPLEADGFTSIGCMPCSDRVAPGEDLRAGRWRGTGKTECGIHRAGQLPAYRETDA